LKNRVGKARRSIACEANQKEHPKQDEVKAHNSSTKFIIMVEVYQNVS
jgi:hypothetical protein